MNRKVIRSPVARFLVAAGKRLNAFHIAIMCWCSMPMLFDGYDLAIYGPVLPRLMSQFLQKQTARACA
jgi:hypothetical protein